MVSFCYLCYSVVIVASLMATAAVRASQQQRWSVANIHNGVLLKMQCLQSNPMFPAFPTSLRVISTSTMEDK